MLTLRSLVSSGGLPVATMRGSIFVATCLFLLYAWPLDREPGVNVYAHMDQAAAIVIDHTLAIDRFMNQPRPNTIDWAEAYGHFYPAKAPGAAFLAVPPFFVLYHVERWFGFDPLAPRWFRRNATFVNWLVNAPLAAFAVVLLLRLSTSLGVGEASSLSGAVAVGIGTAFYPYATVFYAHVPAASAVIAAATLVFRWKRTPITDALAGTLVGTAVLFDYSAGLAVVALTLAVLALRPRSIAAFLAGGLLPMAILFAYHTAAFGGPFATAYEFENPRFAAEDGSFMGGPSVEVLRQLTLAPYRGVFFFSPVLLLAFVGAESMLQKRDLSLERTRQLRVYTATALGLFLSWLLFNASYRVWWGGYTAGPRFIIPGLVLLAPLVGRGLQRFRSFGFALLLISTANYFAITHVWILMPERYLNPLRVIYPSLLAGQFRRSNIGISCGLSPRLSLVWPALIVLVLLAYTWRALDSTTVPETVPAVPSET